MPRRTLPLLALGLLGMLGAPPAGADTPLPPPARHTATSPSGAVQAVSDPATDLTTVVGKGPGGAFAPLWSFAGWYRALYVADDGQHVVLGFDGLNLLPVNAKPDLVVLRFVRRGEVIQALTLGDVLPDLSRLRRTASHLLWREAEGFDAQGRFVLVTVDGVKHVFDPATGRAPGGAPPAATDLEQLAAWMTGSFSSEAQAKEDPEYRDVRLHTARIWGERGDGLWFYVEQAMADAPEAPYRQRVYRLRALSGGLFESHVLELPEPAKAVGAWKDVARLAGLTPEALLDRPGCGVVLRRLDADTFAGSTLGSQCATTFRGAAYVSSEVTVTATGLRTWDRGFDAAGQQVWGATKGPYRFVRQR